MKIEEILMWGGGALLLLTVLKKPKTTTPVIPSNNTGIYYNPANQNNGNSAASVITALTPTVADLIKNIFGDDDDPAPASYIPIYGGMANYGIKQNEDGTPFYNYFV